MPSTDHTNQPTRFDDELGVLDNALSQLAEALRSGGVDALVAVRQAQIAEGVGVADEEH